MGVLPVLIFRLDWAGSERTESSVSLEAGRVQYGQTERRHTGRWCGVLCCDLLWCVVVCFFVMCYDVVFCGVVWFAVVW